MAKNYELEVAFIGGSYAFPKEIYTKIKSPIYECKGFWFFVAKNEKSKINLYDFSSGHCVYRDVQRFSMENLAALVFFIANHPLYRQQRHTFFERNNPARFTVFRQEIDTYHPGVTLLWCKNN